RARVAKDSIDSSDLNQMEAERDALEEMALAEFAAESGIVLEDKSGEGENEDPPPESEEEGKTM
ncbi:MAG: hypothetical protein AAGC68_06565, partial [Verrucomicrobiota bacterium]